MLLREPVNQAEADILECASRALRITDPEILDVKFILPGPAVNLQSSGPVPIYTVKRDRIGIHMAQDGEWDVLEVFCKDESVLKIAPECGKIFIIGYQ